MKNKEFIYEYWGRNELGKKMIASNNVSESDLLFLIPNNVKRMHGLPLTRFVGKKKRKQKKQRKKFILSFSLFDIIEEIIEDTRCAKLAQNKFFEEVVDVRDVVHTSRLDENNDNYKTIYCSSTNEWAKDYMNMKQLKT